MVSPKRQHGTPAIKHLRIVSPDPPSKDYIKQFVATKVGKIRACPYEDIQEEIRAGNGNMEIDSQEAVAAITALEGEIGRKLVGPKDLRRDQLTSLNLVTDLVLRQLENPDAGTRAITSQKKRP